MALNGIDVSRFQAGINFAVVPADFGIVGVSDGYSLNPVADQLYQGIKAARKRRGVYHFYRNDPAEADWFVKQIRGYVGDAVILLDAETDCPDLPAKCLAWLRRVQALTGVRPVLYTYWNLLYASPYRHDWSPVAAAGFPLWEAQYPTAAANYGYGAVAPPPGTGPWPSLLMWQYSSAGRLPGWNGDLDLDVFNGSGADWDHLAAVEGTLASSITQLQEDDLSAADIATINHKLDSLLGITLYGYTTGGVHHPGIAPTLEETQHRVDETPGKVWATPVHRGGKDVSALQELADDKTEGIAAHAALASLAAKLDELAAKPAATVSLTPADLDTLAATLKTLPDAVLAKFAAQLTK